MPNRRDAKLLQGLVRQAREDRDVDVILAESASYFPRPRVRSQFAMSIARAHNQWLRTSWFAWGMCPGGRTDRATHCGSPVAERCMPKRPHRAMS